jgi:aspartate/methionine/tyrosine aminotransferase
MLKLPLPAIKRIESMVQKDPAAISFAQGALRVGGVAPEIRAHAQELLKTDQADYYQSVIGVLGLRQIIAKTLSAQFDTTVTVDEVMVSHGSVGAMMAFSLTVLQPGDEVLLPQPTYPVYYNIVKSAKANPIFVDTYKTTANGWSFDIDAIKAATTDKTKLLMFSNPSNPLGYLTSKHELEELIAWCTSKNIYFLLDEVYDNYVFEGTFQSITPYISSSPFLIRASSFSKNFAMSGWRVGYMVAHPNLVTAMAPVQDAILCCPNVLAQYAAMYALEHPELALESIVKVTKSRKIILDALEPLRAAGIISYNIPKAGFYLFLKTQHQDSYALVLDILKQVKVGLVPGEDFGPAGASYMRICYAREPELAAEGIRRLVEYLQTSTLITQKPLQYKTI